MANSVWITHKLMKMTVKETHILASRISQLPRCRLPTGQPPEASPSHPTNVHSIFHLVGMMPWEREQVHC
jgi:hypothetical protein